MNNMILCIIGKYPPIQGGVSCYIYWLTHYLAKMGHEVHVVTNANEVELDYRMYISDEESSKLECSFENGGFVKLHCTYEHEHAKYIPYTNPFVSKLASLAFDVVKTYNCSFIYTSYLEPYGFAGALVSQWTGIPYSVQHAGSDIGRLAQIPERQSAYLQVIQNADIVITTKSLVRSLVSSGINYENLLFGMPNYLSSEYFTPQGLPLDTPILLEKIKNTNYASPVISRFKFDPNKVTIGIYGKVGKYKGTLELITALGQLRKKGKDFNFIALCGVFGRGIELFKREIQRQELNDCTYLLPYIPHWLVPNFIRTCTAVCFLENRFPIRIHKPQIPREVFACGICLILSQEIYNKQINKKLLVSKENCLIIPDPQNIDYLSDTIQWVIDNPKQAQKIGSYAASTYKLNNNSDSLYNELIIKIDEVVKFKKESSMTLVEFQRALVKIYTESSFRESLRKDFIQNIREYELNQHEIEALYKLVNLTPNIERFTESLVNKKFKFLYKQFSTINTFFDINELDLFNQFKSYYDFINRSWIEEIDYFADFLNKYTSKKLPSLCLYFNDAIKYDQLIKKASLLPLPNENIDFINEEYVTINSINKNFYNIKVLKSKSVFIEKFNYNIPSLYKGVNIQSLKKDSIFFAFIPCIDRPNAEVYRLSSVLYFITLMSENPISIVQLVEQSASFYNLLQIPDKFRISCLAGIQELYEKGILVKSL